MKPDEAFLGQPIRSLQTMLRVYFSDQEMDVTVVPDGVYGKQTMSAVARFQKLSGLPVTGITNQATWEKLVVDYELAQIQTSPGQPIEVILNPGQTICKGESHPHVFLAQSMLLTLSKAYSSIMAPSLTGVIDLPTSDSLESFQMLNSLPITGELDKNTWHALSVHYPLAINLLSGGEIHP